MKRVRKWMMMDHGTAVGVVGGISVVANRPSSFVETAKQTSCKSNYIYIYINN
jgi:hypothetical protein